jgi:L-ascorbate metabolism protein UlaG (beta-lactamase superfamily)
MAKGPVRKWIRRVLRALAALFVIAVVSAIVLGWRGFGHRATGARRARMQASPQWRDGKFRDPQPLRNSALGMLKGAMHISADVSPHAPVPVETRTKSLLATPPVTGLRVTWLGHSTTLVELDGARVLTDPVWSVHSSPIPGTGPARWFDPPIAVAELPPIDAVLISHDHFDHLDAETITAMKDWPTRFIVPLGVGAHLAYWGVPESHIVELDWWERTEVGPLEIVCTPARHASGRMLVDDDAKLWAGWAMIGPAHRVWYSGDTGLHPAMRDIGERLGPFDLTMIEVGQYHGAWPDWHIGPEQAVRAHGWVRGKVMLPVHWGRLALAYHGWTEPLERALAAGEAAGATVLSPRPGQPIEPGAPPPREHWWPSLPWNTAAADPIVSTQVD